MRLNVLTAGEHCSEAQIANVCWNTLP